MKNPVKLYRFAYRLKSLPFIPMLITYFIRLIYGCYLPYTAKIGKNFIIGYGGIGVVIHSRAVIGNNCQINQNVTIGGTSKRHGEIIIGNNVFIGPGAIVLGPIVIGDDVVIGANSVVTKDVPSNSLIMGIPAKIVKSGIKKSDYI